MEKPVANIREPLMESVDELMPYVLGSTWIKNCVSHNLLSSDMPRAVKIYRWGIPVNPPSNFRINV